jgi:hypothetical protein
MRTIAERKLEDSMGGFWCADVTGVRKGGDFVPNKNLLVFCSKLLMRSSFRFNVAAVVTFLHILEDVLDSGHIGAILDVDVKIIFL